MKLTNSTVSEIQPPAKGYVLHYDSDLTGFGLRVTASGVKSYIAEARVAGKTRRVTLGRHGKITSEQARKLARATLGDMTRGTDPSAERRQKKAEGVTLGAAVEAYLKNRRTRSGLPLKERTKADIEYHLSTNFEAWKNRPVAKITREMVQRRYTEIARRSVAQANQAFRVLGAIINYAAASYRDPNGARIIAENPVAVLREANTLRSVQPKSNLVPLDQIGRWWSALEAMRADPALTPASRSAADLIALLALTGLRLGEARAIRWDQLDLKGRSLSLTDTKNRSDVVLPLSEAAAEILEARSRAGEYVFPPRAAKATTLPHLKSCRGQLKILSKQTGIEVTAHDLRRTFRAVAAACNIELWRTKALMNHRQNDDVTLRHYTDLSDVRSLKPEADRIARYFEEQRQIFEADNVVRIASRIA